VHAFQNIARKNVFMDERKDLEMIREYPRSEHVHEMESIWVSGIPGVYYEFIAALTLSSGGNDYAKDIYTIHSHRNRLLVGYG
jgi:hypothetical protein